MENWDDLELLQELSDPNFTIFAAQIEQYDGHRNSRASYDARAQNDQNDQYVAPAQLHNETAPPAGSDDPIGRHVSVAPPVRPILDTHQPAAYTSDLDNGYGCMQNPALTISPTEFDGDSNIIITPPQDYSPTFNAGFGHSSHLKTPSLDSGTTYTTHHGTPNDILSGSEQDLSWLAFPASNSDNLSSTLDPILMRGRAGIKRPSMELGVEEAAEEEGRPKRARSVKNGYKCEHFTCERLFNRACDERKHYKNVHGDKAHGCEHCHSRFPYPKDVRRHMKQVHHIGSPAVEDEKVKPPRRFSSLKSVVSMLANLQLWSKEDPAEEEDVENFILVTQDHRTFRKVYLEGLESSETLMAAIGSAFGMHMAHVDDALLRRCASGGRLGKRIVGPQLMAAVGKAVAAGKTLELFFTPPRVDTRSAAGNDVYAFARAFHCE